MIQAAVWFLGALVGAIIAYRHGVMFAAFGLTFLSGMWLEALGAHLMSVLRAER